LGREANEDLLYPRESVNVMGAGSDMEEDALPGHLI